MLNDIKVGDIVLINKRGLSGSPYSKILRFFSRKPYTHCGIYAGDGHILIADEKLQWKLLDYYTIDDNIQMDIFSVADDMIDLEKVKKLLFTVFYSHHYDERGSYTGLIYFAYRWFMEFLNCNVKMEHNIFGGHVGADIVFRYLLYFNKEYHILQDIGSRYKRHNIHCGDIAEILFSNLAYFRRIYTK